ncbi:hypothetical protein pb186bvf_002194 [Paramecium bursaria]
MNNFYELTSKEFEKSKQSLLQISQQTIEKEKFKKPELRSQLIAIFVFINIALPSINFSFYLTKCLEWEEFNFIGPLSSFFGVIAGLYITNRFSTRIGIFISDTIGILAISIIIPYWYYEYQYNNLLIGYLVIIGFANGISCVMIILYTKYLCPKQYYPFSAMFIGYCVMLGSILYPILGKHLQDNKISNYQTILLSVPLGFYLFRSVMILITFNHDSAVEALVKDNKELALKVLQKFYYTQVIEREFDKCFYEAKRKPKVVFNQLFEVRHRIKIMIGLISMIVQVVVGLTYDFMYYADQTKYQGDDNISIFISVDGLPAILISVLISLHLGYRMTLYVGYILISLCLGVVFFIQGNKWALLSTLVFGFFVFSVVQPIQWLLATLLNDRDGIVFHICFSMGIRNYSCCCCKYFFVTTAFISAPIALLYVIFIVWKIKDNRNLDQEQYLEQYRVIRIQN